MRQLTIYNLEFHENLSKCQQPIMGGTEPPAFSAQVDSNTAVKVVLKTNIDIQSKQASYAYAAGYAGSGAVAASINGQASATAYAYAS